MPALDAADPDAPILADGFSCRTQIAALSGRRARHLAEVLAERLDPRSSEPHQSSGVVSSTERAVVASGFVQRRPGNLREVSVGGAQLRRGRCGGCGRHHQ